MSVKLGIGSYAYGWSIGLPGVPPPHPMTAFDLLDEAAELGLEVVQFCDNLPLHVLPEAELERLARQAQERAIQIEVGTRGIRPNHLRVYLGLAQRLGSAIVRVVIDTTNHQPSLAESIDTLRTTLPEFERSDVCLAIENHDRFTSKQFRQIVESLPSPHVGICLDTVNSFGALEGPESVVRTLAPWIVNVHVKDFLIRRFPHQMGFVIEGCPAGQGRLNLEWLLGELAGAGRDPNLILEQWPPPEETVATTVAKEQRWARSGARYLQSVTANSGRMPQGR